MDSLTNPLLTIISGSMPMIVLYLQTREALLHYVNIHGADTIYDCLFY